MILSNFLSRQKHDDSNPREIIPISFNMQGILHNRYYNRGNLERYLVQTCLQAKSGGIKLTEVHGVGKSLDLDIQPEKQVIKPLVLKAKAQEIPQIKPKLGQGRAGLSCTNPQTGQSIAQSVNQPLNVPTIPNRQNKVRNIHNFTSPVQLVGKSITKVIDRRMIQDTNRKIPCYPDPVYSPPPKPVNTPAPKIPRNIYDIDPELSMDFQDNFPF